MCVKACARQVVVTRGTGTGASAGARGSWRTANRRSSNVSDALQPAACTWWGAPVTQARQTLQPQLALPASFVPSTTRMPHSTPPCPSYCSCSHTAATSSTAHLREQVVDDVCPDVVVDLVEDAEVAVQRRQAAAQVAPLLTAVPGQLLLRVAAAWRGTRGAEHVSKEVLQRAPRSMIRSTDV